MGSFFCARMSFFDPCHGHYPRIMILSVGSCQRDFSAQPSGLNTRSVAAGYLPSKAIERVGRVPKLPPQFGHLPANTVSAQCRQNVHSNEQILASVESAGRSTLQHSQFGRICSMVYS